MHQSQKDCKITISIQVDKNGETSLNCNIQGNSTLITNSFLNTATKALIDFSKANS